MGAAVEQADAQVFSSSEIAAVCYQDAKAAYRWLEHAFGFEPLFVILDADGNLGHSEMTFGNSVVMVGNEWSADHKSPKSIGGKNTQTVHVQLAEGEDIDAHCERARQAGAEILQEPELNSTATAPIARATRKAISGPSGSPRKG